MRYLNTTQYTLNHHKIITRESATAEEPIDLTTLTGITRLHADDGYSTLKILQCTGLHYALN